MKYPLSRVAAKGAVGLIRLYQLVVSPFKGPCCRFTPTCSAYAKQAFLLHGPVKGAILTLNRLCKCHPWGGWGFDPVPPASGNLKEKGKENDTQVRG